MCRWLPTPLLLRRSALSTMPQAVRMKGRRMPEAAASAALSSLYLQLKRPHTGSPAASPTAFPTYRTLRPWRLIMDNLFLPYLAW